MVDVNKDEFYELLLNSCGISIPYSLGSTCCQRWQGISQSFPLNENQNFSQIRDQQLLN